MLRDWSLTPRVYEAMPAEEKAFIGESWHAWKKATAPKKGRGRRKRGG